MQVRRQTRTGYREAIQELRTNPVGGFAKLDAISGILEVTGHERAQKGR